MKKKGIDTVLVGGAVVSIYSKGAYHSGDLDFVKDRLASYIHFKAPEGLDQAVWVAKNQEVNLTSIKKWCKGENSINVFEEFIGALKK